MAALFVRSFVLSPKVVDEQLAVRENMKVHTDHKKMPTWMERFLIEQERGGRESNSKAQYSTGEGTGWHRSHK